MYTRLGLGPLLAITIGVITCVALLLMATGQDDRPCTPPPACPYEDGNPNGLACTWTDPNTGVRYSVDSSEYLN